MIAFVAYYIIIQLIFAILKIGPCLYWGIIKWGKTEYDGFYGLKTGRGAKYELEDT